MDPIVKLVETIKTDFKSGKLKVPSLPEVAFKIRAAIQDDSKNAFEIAKIVQLDPVLTSRLLQVANSPLYRCDKEIVECQVAISRIGVRVARNLVTSFAVQQVFGARNPLVRKALKDNWRHSAHVAAIAYILGRVTPGVQPDTALLGALVHDIGVLPILRYAEDCPEVLNDKARFFQLINKISARLGAAVLKSWGMDQSIIAIPEQIGNRQYQPEQGADNTDVIIVSHFHSDYSDNKYENLEFLSEVCSYSKLAISRFGADASLELIDNAKDEISEIISLVISWAIIVAYAASIIADNGSPFPRWRWWLNGTVFKKEWC